METKNTSWQKPIARTRFMDLILAPRFLNFQYENLFSRNSIIFEWIPNTSHNGRFIVFATSSHLSEFRYLKLNTVLISEFGIISIKHKRSRFCPNNLSIFSLISFCKITHKQHPCGINFGMEPGKHLQHKPRHKQRPCYGIGIIAKLVIDFSHGQIGQETEQINHGGNDAQKRYHIFAAAAWKQLLKI